MGKDPSQSDERRKQYYGRSYCHTISSFAWTATTQGARNGLAQSLIVALRAGEKPRLSLYLRPFRFDNTSFFKKSECLLARLLDRHMPLVCLCSKSFAIGASRLRTSNERWKEDFSLLVKNAAAIFCQDPRGVHCPDDFIHIDDAEGLQFEYETLAREDLTSRLVFVFQGGGFTNTDNIADWAPSTQLNFAEVLAPGVGLRPLNEEAINEILSNYVQYQELGLDPPAFDRSSDAFCNAFITHWHRPDVLK